MSHPASCQAGTETAVQEILAMAARPEKEQESALDSGLLVEIFSGTRLRAQNATFLVSLNQ